MNFATAERPRRGKITMAAERALRCLLLLILLHGAAAAQDLDWTDISGPPGHELLYELGDGTLFAIDDGNVLIRSFDGGATWQGFTRPGGPILEFDARASVAVIAVQRAQAANFKQYFATTDRGTTWSRIAVEGSVGIHVMLRLSPDGIPHALYQVGVKMAVERLVDSVWQRLGLPSGVFVGGSPPLYTDLAVDGGGNLYIGTYDDGIHSSRNGGFTWAKTLPYHRVGAGPVMVAQNGRRPIAIAPNGRVAISTIPNGRTVGGVFVSADSGATWTPSGMTDINLDGIAFNPANDFIALGARPGEPSTRIYRLDAGTADWDSSDAFDFAYSTLHVAGSGRFIVTSPELGLNISDDDGTSWGSDGIRHQDLFAVDTAPDGSLLGGTIGKGIFRSTNGGGRWERITAAGTPDYFYDILHQDTLLLGGTEHGLYASADNGLSWSSLTGSLNPGGVDLPVYAVVAPDDSSVVIGTAAGVFGSTDRGHTWAPFGLESSEVHALAVAPDGSLYAATGTDGVFSSGDGGRSWAPKGLVQPDLQTVAVSGAGQVYVGASSGVYYSTDAGSSWTRKIFTSGHVHSILFNGNFNMFAGSSTGLFVSSDAGRTWAAAGLDGLFVVGLSYDEARSMTAVIYKGGILKTLQVITGVSDTPAQPVAASLSQNYPNPFNPATTIAYTVPSSSRVTLRVYDVLGRVSETLVDALVPAGSYERTWNGEGRPSGVYFYSIAVIPEGPGDRGRAHREIRKMLLLR